jgi:hypothetical protein
VVDAVVQPEHRAGPRRYEIDSAWITTFFLDLRDTRRTVRAQVHTHPGDGVRHSPTDDCFPIAPGAGFISIVLPHFATGTVSVAGGSVSVQGADGTWNEVEPADVLAWR